MLLRTSSRPWERNVERTGLLQRWDKIPGLKPPLKEIVASLD
jgi:hypothetical protein